jgi:hypothetical protein
MTNEDADSSVTEIVLVMNRIKERINLLFSYGILIQNLPSTTIHHHPNVMVYTRFLST